MSSFDIFKRPLVVLQFALFTLEACALGVEGRANFILFLLAKLAWVGGQLLDAVRKQATLPIPAVALLLPFLAHLRFLTECWTNDDFGLRDPALVLHQSCKYLGVEAEKVCHGRRLRTFCGILVIVK